MWCAGVRTGLGSTRPSLMTESMEMKTSRALVSIALALTSSCGLDSAGSGGSSTLDPVDSTATQDEGVGTTKPTEDTSSDDTTPTTDSTIPTDTLTPPDTTPTPDTEPTLDTTPTPDTIATIGELTGSGAGLPPTAWYVNLTTEGTLDWAHWGFLTASSFDHKKSKSEISKGTPVGTPTQYGGYPITFTWSDGEPTAAATTPSGLFFSGTGTFSFQANADDKVTRTLKVYAAWLSCTGTVRARLSDASAPEWTGPVPPPGSAGAGNVPVVYTFNYRAGSKGQTLIVELKQTAGTYLSLLSATLK